MSEKIRGDQYLMNHTLVALWPPTSVHTHKIGKFRGHHVMVGYFGGRCFTL